MYGSKEYRFAVALLQFSKAWEELAQASAALPDMDVSDLYPFYLLDYEAIQPAVKQWCLHNAAKIMQFVPDITYNPACAKCKYLSAGINDNGLCKGADIVHCNNYPMITFSVQAVAQYMAMHNIDIQQMTPETVQLMYTRKVEEENAES